jgi:drug/metabolite transporter (DMT)-like permease
MASAPGIITSFYRLAIAAVVLSVPFVVTQFKKKKKAMPFKGILFATLAGFCFATDMALWSTGIVASNATLPTLTGNLAPLWVGIGAVVFFKEKQKVGFWLGLLLAFIGVSMLMLNHVSDSSGLLKGMLLGLFAGMFYAGYYLFAQPGRKYLDTLTFLYISTVSSSLFLGIYAAFMDLGFTGFDNRTWLLFVILGVGIQAGAWFLISYAQGYLPASTVSPTLLGQPVISAFLAYFILKEQLTAWHIVSGVVVVAGIYLVHFSRKERG